MLHFACTYSTFWATKPWISATVEKYDANGKTWIVLDFKSQLHEEKIIFWSTEALITNFSNTLIPKISKQLVMQAMSVVA